MDIKEAIKILKAHNLWRRDHNIPNQYEMGDATKLGIAIDTVVKYLENKDD